MFGDREMLPVTRIGGVDFRWGERTYVMGIVNVSPESFSGDGICGVERALEQAKKFVAEGADILDIGGESTRPGSKPVSQEQEIERVVPVIEAISANLKVPISVDTCKPAVASRALEAGAHIVNDIWGCKKGSGAVREAARSDAAVILMSNQRKKPASSIIPVVLEELGRAIENAISVGVSSNNIIVDPGIGFGKTVEQNLEIIYRLNEIRGLGKPVLLGTSRKSFIGWTLGLPEDDRLEGTAATVAIGIAAGADIIRVHDVKAMKRVACMSDAIVRRN